MTQWLLEEALTVRLETVRELAHRAELEQRQLEHQIDQARRDAIAALER